MLCRSACRKGQSHWRLITLFCAAPGTGVATCVARVSALACCRTLAANEGITGSGTRPMYLPGIFITKGILENYQGYFRTRLKSAQRPFTYCKAQSTSKCTSGADRNFVKPYISSNFLWLVNGLGGFFNNIYHSVVKLGPGDAGLTRLRPTFNQQNARSKAISPDKCSILLQFEGMSGNFETGSLPVDNFVRIRVK